MLRPTKPPKKFEKYGFKKCKGDYGQNGCYYLCVTRGCKMLFVSNTCFDVFNWENDDPRIHKKANCKYRDKRTVLDIVYQLIKDGMLVSEYYSHVSGETIFQFPFDDDVKQQYEQKFA